MELPNSSAQPGSDLNSFPIDPSFSPQPLDAMELQLIPPVPINRPSWDFLPPDQHSNSIELHPSGPSGGWRMLPPQSQAPSAYNPVPPLSYSYVGQPGPNPPQATVNVNPIPSDRSMVHQQYGATGTIQVSISRSSRTYECKWTGCHSTTRFSREGDLIRHIKTIHISPEVYPCSKCGKAFGRKDHLREHQRRRHHT